MILADSSVWIDHFRTPNERLTQLADEQMLIIHPFVVGELSLGSLKDRGMTLRYLNGLPHAPLAHVEEVAEMIELRRLFSRGLGYIDVHLLASAMLASIGVWTRDRRLREAAILLGVAA
jgi:predicted nucleic acid-binding protein